MIILKLNFYNNNQNFYNFYNNFNKTHLYITLLIFRDLMINQSNKVLNTNITKLVNKTYQYGFSTKIEKEIIEKGLNEQVIRLISQKKNEPQFLLEFRLKAYQRWKKMTHPEWACLKFPQINYQNIIYYSAPKSKRKIKWFK